VRQTEPIIGLLALRETTWPFIDHVLTAGGGKGRALDGAAASQRILASALIMPNGSCAEGVATNGYFAVQHTLPAARVNIELFQSTV
jgi:hypothetical protein